MKEPIDHEARTGKPYEAKPPKTDEQRRAASEKMKEFNRKTGKNTLLGNRLAMAQLINQASASCATASIPTASSR